MKQLTLRLYTLISQAVRTIGSYNPHKIMFLFEEELYDNEIDLVYNFLLWLHENELCMGRGNWQSRFKEFKEWERIKKLKSK